MKTLKLFLCVLACSALPTMTGFSQQPKFSVKTGLWEQTTLSHTMSAAQAHTTQVCMSKDKMDHGFVEEANHPGCMQTVVTNTPTVLEIREECSNPTGKVVVTIHYKALSRETVTGKTHLEMTSAGHTTVSDATIQGKWVSYSCGDVK